MFTENERVRVIVENKYKGTIGRIMSTHTDLGPEPVYLVGYESNFDGGNLFKESGLTKLSLENPPENFSS